MPVPVSVLPVRARLVLSLWISSQDASDVGSSDVRLSAAWRESPAGIESETKRAPPIFTKPRRVMGAVSGVRIVTDATGNSLDAFIFGVIEAPSFPRASRWPRVARHR